MKCDKIKELFPEYLMNHPDQGNREKVDLHLIECDNCKQELEHLKTIWTKLGTIPEEEPAPVMRTRFYFMLEAYQQGLQHSRHTLSWRERFTAWLEGWWWRRPAFQFVVVLLCLMTGLLIGRQMDSGVHSTNKIAQLKQEIQGMRQMVTLSLLNQPSSSERLRGISLSYRVYQPADELLSALINTVNSDPNVNVRLAAVDALYLFSNKLEIRDELIQSLAKQTSPLVQISLINLLVEFRERNSLEALKKLVKNNQINHEVKQQAQWGIEQLF